MRDSNAANGDGRGPAGAGTARAQSAQARGRVEPSAAIGFSANAVLREGETRTETSLADALTNKSARIALTWGGNWLCRGRAEGPPELLYTVDDAHSLGLKSETLVLLGTLANGAPHLAGEIAAEPTAPEFALTGLRALAASGGIDPELEGLLGHAQHLLHWHARNGFCARCGSQTRMEHGGFRRRCTGCDATVFPRVDPVTIMLVHDGAGSCIMGRQPHFPERMWSCLAGFVEAGETMEDAVRRETLEEAGVRVATVRYHASQPWPFPGNLMIGCIARAETTDIVFDAAELEDCRWFPRAELRAMLEKRHPDGLTVPEEVAIAHHLLKAFVEGVE